MNDTPKFVVGEQVKVQFNDVDFVGVVKYVFPKENGNEMWGEGPHYMVEGHRFYLHNDSDGKDCAYSCNLRVLPWPECVLRKLPQPIMVGNYEAKISEDGSTVKVGCTTVTRETVEKVLQAMKEANTIALP